MKFIQDPNGSDAMRASNHAVTCVATGRSTDPDGFFTAERDVAPTGRPVPVVVAAAWVKEASRQLGWVSPEEIEEINRLIAERDERIAELSNVSEKVSSLERSLAEFAAVIEPEKEQAAA